MTLRTWALFAITELVLCFSPGPAVLFVVGSALRHGAPASLRSNLGILSANAIYFALSAAGLGTLLLASYTLFTVLKWVGAAYLIWLGLLLLLPSKPSDGPKPEREQPGARQLFVRGVALQLANPKTLVFFVALLPQFVDPKEPMLTQFAILAVTSIALEFFVLGLYGFAAAAASRRLSTPVWQRRIDLVSGGFLVGAGLQLARQSD
jgi:homoserine/homoserine lactone efflux protein